MPLLLLSPRAGRGIFQALRKVRYGLLLVFLPLAAGLALPSLLIALLVWWSTSRTWDSQERWSGVWLLAGVGGAVYGGLLWASHPLPSLLYAATFGLFHGSPVESEGALLRLWSLHLLLAPACALALEGLHPLSQRVRLTPRRPSTPSTRSVARASDLEPPLEPLGEFLGGDLYEWVYGNELCIPRTELMRHIVVVGEPGYGKTVTLLRLAQVAVRYGMQVVYLDLKGSRKTAAQFVALMRLLGVGRIKVYPREPYDGWRGDAQTLYNRLMQMVDAGTHPFYRRLTSALVSLAVGAPGGPPGSSREFLRRLDRTWLYRAHAGKSPELAAARRTIARLAPHLDDLSLPFEGFFDAVAGALDGAWAFEDADAGYLGLDEDARKEQAALMGRYLLEDVAHYARYRKGPRHALLILDEFGVLESATGATDLYERVREPGMSVCAASQSFEGLGPERRQIVSASSIKILHRCGDPQELVRYAGEREVPAFSHLLEEGEEGLFQPIGSEDHPGGRTAVRLQRQYTMPIEAVQQLGVGTAGLITGGLCAWCKVAPLELPEDLLRDALEDIAAPLAISSAPSLPEPEPVAPSEPATRPPSERSAHQQPARDRGRDAQKESRHPGTPQVPATQAPPGRVVSAPAFPAERGQPAPASDDDSPVDF